MDTSQRLVNWRIMKYLTYMGRNEDKKGLGIWGKCRVLERIKFRRCWRASMVVTERLERKRVFGQTLEKFHLIWSISSLKKSVWTHQEMKYYNSTVRSWVMETCIDKGVWGKVVCVCVWETESKRETETETEVVGGSFSCGLGYRVCFCVLEWLVNGALGERRNVCLLCIGKTIYKVTKPWPGLYISRARRGSVGLSFREMVVDGTGNIEYAKLHVLHMSN